MSEQKATTEAVDSHLLPRQPEVNIGTAGHVDHGKCLTPDQYVLVNGDLVTGREILRRLKHEGVLLVNADGGSTYQVGTNKVVSLNEALQPTHSDSLVYVQEYSGPVYSIRTETGRSITVSPEHPLLVNRTGKLTWVRAKDLSLVDRVAFTRTVPLGEHLVFPDEEGALSEWYEIITWKHSERLRNATQGFTSFVTLSGRDFELLRLMVGVSRTELAGSLRTDRCDLGRVLSGQQTRPDLLRRLCRFFEATDIAPLAPDELVIASKELRTGVVYRFREPQFDDDLVKWFAFVLAEGHVGEYGIGIAKKIQLDMLREVLGITERKFGLSFRSVGKIDYQLNSKALVDYLRSKYSVEPGPKRDANFPGWLLKLPQSQKALFLRWFFTLDGEFNGKAGQISITRVNERSIVLFGYLLGSFGIVPRFGVKRVQTAAGVVQYHRLSVSGRQDLETFSRLIGFQNRRINRRLSQYLLQIDARSKRSDLSIPIDRAALKGLLARLGAVREGFGTGADLQPMKRAEWYKAYEDSRHSMCVSRQKLVGILASVDVQVRKLELALSTTRPTRASLLQSMYLTRLSQKEAASRLGFSRKVLVKKLRDEDRATLKRLETEVRNRIDEILSASGPEINELKRLANASLEFDKIKSIDVKQYSGTIFDLSVPEHGNFLGGVGAIVCHNTSAVQAITGVWASAHSEELRRGITIKVGYADAAFYKCPVTPPPASYSTSKICPVCGTEAQLLRAVSFVDCPGHESLMTNMLAGAFLMDGALLVIAANESVPKPQTREHLQALQMLGMKRVVIAQNKVDLVTDEEAKQNQQQIRTFVANTVAADAPVIPISAQQRLNIDALIEALQEVVPTPSRNPGADSLMYVVRSFDVNRPGMEVKELSGGVLGGSLVRGELSLGQEIELKPGMVEERSGAFTPVVTKVSSLQTGAGAAEKVGPGGLIAVGTLLDPAYTKGDQMVGSVIGRPGTLPPTWQHMTLDVALFETAVGAAELVKVDKVRPGENLRLNMGTASAPAVVTSARDDVIEVDLKKPVAIEEGMRAAVSRRIAERWRLIGSGILK